MKLVSWNVNGLRAAITKGFYSWVENENADVICLQETKLSEGQLDLDAQQYDKYFNYAEKKGYSGTAILSKKEALSVSYGIGVDIHDKEGRVITVEYPEFYLVCVYVPNSQKELLRLSYRRAWNLALEDYICMLDKKKPVVMTGDLNVAHHPIDLKNPKSNEKNAGFSPEERSDFTRMLSKGFVDSFRYLHPDEVKYSWWSYMFHAREKNAGWRIDYFLVSERIKDKIKVADIETDVLGSDHCPVVLELDF